MRKRSWQKLNTRNIGIESFLFGLFLALFPIDSALGNIIGSMSLNNYIALAAVFLLFIFSYNRIKFAKENIFIIIGIYFVYSIVTIVVGPKMFGSRNLVFVIYMLIAIIFSNVMWTKDEIIFFKQSIVLGLIVVISIVFSRFDFNSSGRLYITIGRNIDQNYLCANLIFATAILSENVAMKNYKLLSLILLLMEFITIILLGSRGGLLGNLVVVIVCFILRKHNAWKYILAITLIGFIVLEMFSDKLPSWIIERFDIKNMLHGTGSGRTIIWADYLSKFRNSPILKQLFGYGRGIIYESEFYKLATHNMFIKALIEGGLVGFIIYFILLIYIFIYAAQKHEFKSVAFIAGYIVSGMFLDLDDYRIFPVMIILTIMFAKKRNILKICANKEGAKLC